MAKKTKSDEQTAATVVPELPPELKRAVEIHRLADTAVQALTRIADLAAGGNEVGSMGRINDLLDGIRNLPCVREANGVAKALAVALPNVDTTADGAD